MRGLMDVVEIGTPVSVAALVRRTGGVISSSWLVDDRFVVGTHRTGRPRRKR